MGFHPSSTLRCSPLRYLQAPVTSTLARVLFVRLFAYYMFNRRPSNSYSCTDGLALKGHAPRIFARVTSWGLPYLSVVVSAAFGLLAYMGVSSGAGRVFGWYVPPNNMTISSSILLAAAQVLGHDFRSWFDDLVRYFCDLPPFPRRNEGSKL
jgi:hypothetical protein